MKFNNGHRYRLSAGSRLAATLTHAITQYPEAKHFIIAHSHGGNVAFYALRAGQLSRRIAGVICIATPFITCQPRDGSSTTRFYPIILWTIFAFAALLPITIIGIVPAAKVLTFLTSKFPSMAEPMIWIWAGGISVGLYLLCAKLPTKLINDWMIPWLEEWVARKQQGIVARLSLPLLPDQPTRCIRAAGDEATRHLSMVKGAGDLPYGVWRGGLYMISFLLIAGLAFAFPGDSATWIGYLPVWIPPDSPATAERLRSAGASAGMILMLVSAVHFAMLAIVPWATRGRGFGFGQEGILHNMLVEIGVSGVRPGLQVTEKQYTLTHAGLRHSGLYRDEQVLVDIAEWIRASRANQCSG